MNVNLGDVFDNFIAQMLTGLHEIEAVDRKNPVAIRGSATAHQAYRTGLRLTSPAEHPPALLPHERGDRSLFRQMRISCNSPSR